MIPLSEITFGIRYIKGAFRGIWVFTVEPVATENILLSATQYQNKEKLPFCRGAPVRAPSLRADTWVRPYNSDSYPRHPLRRGVDIEALVPDEAHGGEVEFPGQFQGHGGGGRDRG